MILFILGAGIARLVTFGLKSYLKFAVHGKCSMAFSGNTLDMILLRLCPVFEFYIPPGQ